MTRFTIDVYADTACPWSYVGKEFMDKAIREWRASRPDDEFDVVWKPFYLHPQAKVSAYERKWVYTRTMGEERAAQFFRHIDAAAERLDLTIKWTGRTGNTKASHRLLRLARDQDMAVAMSSSSASSSSPLKHTTTTAASRTQSAAAALPTPSSSFSSSKTSSPPISIRALLSPAPEEEEQEYERNQRESLSSSTAMRTSHLATHQNRLLAALFEGQFAHERDVSDEAFLVAAATAAGLAPSEARARAALADPGLAAAADADERAARRDFGITASPSYIVQGRYKLGGCQEDAVFRRVFTRVVEDEGAGGGGGGERRSGSADAQRGATYGADVEMVGG